MRFKPIERGGGIVVELGRSEGHLPSVAAQEVTGALPLFKLKKILVPVDFSDCSKRALGYAIAFARQFDAELTLLHVVPINPPISEMGSVDLVTVEEARKDLEEVQAMVGPAVASHTVVRQGEAHFEITRAAKELGSDLVILSTHGRSGLARVLMGSTAEKVVRHAGCPVLVVREHEHEFIADNGRTPVKGV